MPKSRGGRHTTLTETAQTVVSALKSQPGITMIAPGEIRMSKKPRGGKRHLTIVTTVAGLRLIVTGQGIQYLSVHTKRQGAIIKALKEAKTLRSFIIRCRERT